MRSCVGDVKNARRQNPEPEELHYAKLLLPPMNQPAVQVAARDAGTFGICFLNGRTKCQPTDPVFPTGFRFMLFETGRRQRQSHCSFLGAPQAFEANHQSPSRPSRPLAQKRCSVHMKSGRDPFREKAVHGCLL